MGQFEVIIQPTAERDLVYHKKSGNKPSINKLLQILGELQIHPFSGVGKPERLKYDLEGYWSRRINRKDRIIYCLKDGKILVLSARGHYLKET